MFRRFTYTLLLAVATAAARPLLHYPLERPGDPVANAAGAGYAGRPMLLDTAEYVPAVTGMGVRLTGQGEHLAVPLTTPLPDRLVISGYFRAELFHCEQALLMFYTGAEHRLLALRIANRRLTLLEEDGPQRRRWPAGPALDDRRFHHFALALDGRRRRLFLDGAPILEQTGVTELSTLRPTTLFFGTDYHSAVHSRYRFVGVLDELRVDDTLEEAALPPLAAAAAAAPLPPAPTMPAAAVPPVQKARVNPAHFSFVHDGHEEPFMMYAGAGGFMADGPYVLKTLPEASRAGMDVIRCSVQPGREFCGGVWWVDDDTYDFSAIERNLALVFRRNPKARMILSVAVSPPAWWGVKHPDEITADFAGRRRQDYFASHSFASERWLTDAERALDALFRHLKQTSYWERITGVFLTAGRYGETIRSGYNCQLYGRECTDYCPAELHAFQKWLRGKYGDLATMRKAYRDGAVPESFEKVALPTPQERLRPDSSYFCDPVADRKVLDYSEFISASTAAAVIRYTTFVRRMIGPDKCLGLYYGYVREDAFGGNRSWATDSGHMGLAEVLRQAPVDFLAGPVGYYQRELGNVGPNMGAPASVRLHGKLWMDEADIRTSLTGGHAEYSGARDLEESLAVLWRTFGNCLVERDGLWWSPLKGEPSYSHPRIWEAFAKMHREMRHAAANPPPADHRRSLAVIVDPRSLAFRRFSYRDPIAGQLVSLSRDVLAKAALECDTYLIDDLESIPDDYGAYLFLNSFYLDQQQRDLIARRLHRNNQLLVFTYGAGYFGNASSVERYAVKVQNMEQLLGMQMSRDEVRLAPATTPAPGAPHGLGPLTAAGACKPVFSVADPAAQVWARYAGAPALAGKAAVAWKQQDGWRSMYIGVPIFTTGLLRAIADLAGLHVWSDAANVVVRPGNGHVLLHSGHDAQVRVTLPRPAAQVVDVDSGEVLARNRSTLTVPIGRNRTRLLRLEE